MPAKSDFTWPICDEASQFVPLLCRCGRLREYWANDEFWTEGVNVTDDADIFISPQTTSAIADALRGLTRDEISALYSDAVSAGLRTWNPQSRAVVEQLVAEIAELFQMARHRGHGILSAFSA